MNEQFAVALPVTCCKKIRNNSLLTSASVLIKYYTTTSAKKKVNAWLHTVRMKGYAIMMVLYLVTDLSLLDNKGIRNENQQPSAAGVLFIIDSWKKKITLILRVRF